MSSTPLPIEYFSDVLCIWAYAAQTRVESISENFNDQVRLQHRYISIFGHTAERIGEGWKDQGGYAGFNQHLQHVCEQFDDIQVHDDCWIKSPPTTSANAHLFLKAIQCLHPDEGGYPELVNTAAIKIREAFFKEARDISQFDTLYAIAESLNIYPETLSRYIHNGQALAQLCYDAELKEKYRIEGSPTFVLNEGRQKLYGNVGYKIINANINELLNEAHQSQGSLCGA